MRDDLVPLFAHDEPEWGLRQGIILTWDALAGTSTVQVGGAVLTDLPFLSEAGQVFYSAGDPVLLIRYKSSWAIVGRYVAPGAQAAIGRYFELTGAYDATPGTNFSLTTSYVTKNTVSVYVPTWARVATGTVSFVANARNSTAAEDFLNARILLAGIPWAGAVSPTVPAGKWGSATVLAHFQVLVTPGGTIELEGQLATTTAAWTAHTSAAAHAQATVTFNSNVG